MPRVEIRSPNASTIGTTVLIDGREVPEVTRVSLDFTFDAVTAIALEVNANKGLLFVGDEASLKVSILAVPGFEIIEDAQPDGSKRYRGVALLASEVIGG